MAKSFKSLIDRRRKTASYKFEKIKLSVSISLNRLIKNAGISKTELADSVGVSPAYISKALKGDANFTLETLVKLSDALECNVNLNFTHQNNTFRWFEVISSVNYDNSIMEHREKLFIDANMKKSIKHVVRQNGEIAYAAA